MNTTAVAARVPAAAPAAPGASARCDNCGADAADLTLSKLVVLSFFYLVSGLLMLALVGVYSVLTL
jgi:hypothetical protein